MNDVRRNDVQTKLEMLMLSNPMMSRLWNAKAEKIHDIENHTKTTVIKPRK